MGRERFGIFILILSAIAILVIAEELYTSKYDNVNVDLILANPRLRNQYLNCYLGKGPCITPDARFLKEKFPEAVVTRCQKCTNKQREFFDKVTDWYTQHEPETWDKVVRKTIEDAQKGH